MGKFVDGNGVIVIRNYIRKKYKAVNDRLTTYGNVIADTLSNLHDRAKKHDIIAATALNDLNTRVKNAAKSTEESGHYTPAVPAADKPVSYDGTVEKDNNGNMLVPTDIITDSKGHVIDVKKAVIAQDYDSESGIKRPLSKLNWLHILYFSAKDQRNIILNIPLEGYAVVIKQNNIKYGWLRNNSDGKSGWWTRCRVIFDDLHIADDSYIDNNNDKNTAAAIIIKNIKNGNLSELFNHSFRSHYNRYRIGTNAPKHAFVARNIQDDPNSYKPERGTWFYAFCESRAGQEQWGIHNNEDYTYCDWDDFNGDNKAEERLVNFELFDAAIDLKNIDYKLV